MSGCILRTDFCPSAKLFMERDLIDQTAICDVLRQDGYDDNPDRLDALAENDYVHLLSFSVGRLGIVGVAIGSEGEDSFITVSELAIRNDLRGTDGRFTHRKTIINEIEFYFDYNNIAGIKIVEPRKQDIPMFNSLNYSKITFGDPNDENTPADFIKYLPQQ